MKFLSTITSGLKQAKNIAKYVAIVTAVVKAIDVLTEELDKLEQSEPNS